ncbi:uncharacterized protein LOC129587852 [Paramacrobiotus metropolitanus]|uniref:uncharacterized protein LOC129587852 n=1 Tax=Paramacrobiotus metropolitanus TaxID=2943436 RepID=UPI00244601E3|nr:uncharacterized protein LOC129587852 [Paramacrobiotus metropolitanus]
MTLKLKQQYTSETPRSNGENDMQPLQTLTRASSTQESAETRSRMKHTMELLDLNDNVLYQICRPFILVMRIGGIFFLPTKLERVKDCHSNNYIPDEPDDFGAGRRTNRNRSELLCQIYCCTALCIVVTYGCKFAYNFYAVITPMGDNVMTTTNLATLVLMLSFSNWHINMIFSHFIMLRACWRSSLIYEFFVLWERARYICPEENCNRFCTRFRSIRNVVVMSALFCVFANMLSVFLPLLIASKDYEAVRQVIYAGFGTDNIPICIFQLIGHFFASFIYILPVFFYVLLCQAVAQDFQHLNRDLSDRIGEDGSFSGNLEWYRLRHIQLCRLVEHGDNVFSLFTLVSIASSVAQMFMLVFVTFEYGRKGLFSVVSGLTEFFWFLLYLLQPALLFGMGMKLNEAAHSPLWALYQLNHEKLATSEVLQLHTFLNNLSCNQIGFTAWKMFVVEAPALLSILGIYCTYQILLFQLQLDLDDKSDNSTKGH